MMLKALIQKFLSTRDYRAGEMVQLGWFIFRIADDARPPSVESLDFKRIASFTSDFAEADRIYLLQREALSSSGLDEKEEGCTLRHSALVSRSYLPGHGGAFIRRERPTDQNDSGWYVGVLDDEADMYDVRSISRRSLYELTIADLRMASFWLLPIGTTVLLASGEVRR